MKTYGIAQKTLITTAKGNVAIENCFDYFTALSCFDEKPTDTTVINVNRFAIGEATVYKLRTKDGRTIETTENCEFVTDTGAFVELFSILANSSVMTVDGPVLVEAIESKRVAPIYAVVTEGNATFIANGFILHTKKG